MDSLLQTLSMGGYASFVWSAYGIVCVTLTLNIIGCQWQQKRIRTSLKNWFKRTSS